MFFFEKKNQKTSPPWRALAGDPPTGPKSFLLLFCKKEGLAFLDLQRGRFILWLPACLAAGALLYFSLTFEPSPWWALLGVAPLAAAWRWPIPRALALCVAFFAAGVGLAGLRTALMPGWVALPRHAIEVVGEVAALEVLPEGRRVTIARPALDGAAVARSVRVRLRAGDATAVSPGDVVRVRALLRAPAPPDYPGGWDTQRDAFFSGIAGYGFAIGTVDVVRAAGGGIWAGLRARVAQRLMAGLPGPDGAIAATLLAGEGTAIPPAERTAFQDSGLAHLLAVAGLHIGIVIGLVFWVTRFGLALWERAALYWPTRQIAALSALVAGGGYLALTGAHVPIIRSFAMAALVTLGVLTGRRAVSFRGLALAALVLLALAPESAVGVGFQMSFASVLVLIAGWELARPWLGSLGEGAWWRGAALFAGGLMLTSLLAGTASLSFAAYHFGRATLYYVPANMVAVPLAAFWVMPWGLLALALMPLGLERAALVPMGWGIEGLRAIAHTVAGWPGAVVEVRQGPAWALALVGAGIVWACVWRGRLRLAGALPLTVGLLAPFLVRGPDGLVTQDAAVIALRSEGRTLVQVARGASAFAKAAPGRVWGGDIVAVPCEAPACAWPVGGRRVVVARERDGVDCSAGLLISAARLGAVCGAVPILDRALLADGPAVFWMAPGGVIAATDAATRGQRPWVIATRPQLPMAQTE
jgi:competence protein ComEC